MIEQLNLTDKEKELIYQFNENAELSDVIHKCLTAGIYFNGVVNSSSKHDPLQNWALALVFNREQDLSNEQLGQDLRASAEGIKFLESAFKNIQKVRRTVDPLPKVNKAK